MPLSWVEALVALQELDAAYADKRSQAGTWPAHLEEWAVDARRDCALSISAEAHAWVPVTRASPGEPFAGSLAKTAEPLPTKAAQVGGKRAAAAPADVAAAAARTAVSEGEVLEAAAVAGVEHMLTRSARVLALLPPGLAEAPEDERT